MTSLGMPSRINGEFFVETETGYEKIGRIESADIETVPEVDMDWAKAIKGFEGEFTVTLGKPRFTESNNHRKMHGKPLRRKWINNPYRFLVEGLEQKIKDICESIERINK